MQDFTTLSKDLSITLSKDLTLTLIPYYLNLWILKIRCIKGMSKGIRPNSDRNNNNLNKTDKKRQDTT